MICGVILAAALPSVCLQAYQIANSKIPELHRTLERTNELVTHAEQETQHKLNRLHATQQEIETQKTLIGELQQEQVELQQQCQAIENQL